MAYLLPNRIVLAASFALAAFGGAATTVAQQAKRTPWTTSKLHGGLHPPAPYRSQPAFPKLTFKNPTVLTNAPGTDRLFVVELQGKVYSFKNRRDVAKADLIFDLKQAVPKARQVYGLTFHPDFASNRFCYLCYVLEADLDDGTRLSRFRMSDADPPAIIADSEEILLTWRSGGHNGGCLKFGPDGYLYVSAGDAGPAFPPDPLKTGQDVSNVMATIMRIDVDQREGERKYRIPEDNPFVNLSGARGEVWAYGFRNPWKMSFDRVTGDLWVGDVGWELWEMVYRVEKAGNYGWSLVEGRQPVHRERTRGPTPILKPTAEHPHTESRSITGGFVYRGDRLKALRGQYVYGDYVTGKMWALEFRDGKTQRIREIADTHMPIICFGVDNNDELYLVSYEGQIHRLELNNATASSRPFPKRLSETGLFRSAAEHQLASGVESYEIVAEMWQDDVTSQRFVAVPGSAPLDTWKANNTAYGQYKGEFRFPEGSVIGKTIMLPTPDRRRVETQILHYHNEIWEPYTYVWNAEQTDARLLESAGESFYFEAIEPKSGAIERRSWRIAGRNECILCHTTRSGSLQAFHLGQLERDIDRDGQPISQLAHLAELGFFPKTPKRARNQREYVSPYDESADINDRARTYLHVNCAHCHRRGGGGTASMDVVYRNKLDRTNLLHERPTQGAFGMHGAEVVSPGDPFRSVLLYRVSKFGRGRMPYYGSGQVDARGVAMLRDWIRSLAPVDGANPPPSGRSDRRARNGQLVEAAMSETAARGPAIRELLSTTSGALRLAVAVHEQGANESLKTQIVAALAKQDDAAIRDLFNHLLPESMRRRTLGEAIDAKRILSLKGDSVRGKELFEKAVGLQCRKCHLPEQKESIGPKLSDLKKRTKADLLESILQPSKRIEPQFVTHLVETKDGRVLTGLLRERNANRVVLVDATGKLVAIETANIEFSSPQQKSLMPELQLRDSTAQEVADLLEYLAAKE